MRDTYSLYEAKARLSALVRMVREGRRIVITVHGRPAAELRPVESEAEGLDERVRALVDRGVIAERSQTTLPGPVARKPGALARFLAERE